MAAQIYLKKNPVTGLIEEIRATEVSTGVAEAGNIAALDGTGRLHQSMMPVGIGPDTKACEAGEALAGGSLVYVANDGGTDKVFKSHAGAGGNAAVGYVKNGYSVGETALVYFEGPITALSGLTTNARYFLSETPGEVTDTPVGPGGKLHQPIGRAVSSTELSFEPAEPIKTVSA